MCIIDRIVTDVSSGPKSKWGGGVLWRQLVEVARCDLRPSSDYNLMIVPPTFLHVILYMRELRKVGKTLMVKLTFVKY